MRIGLGADPCIDPLTGDTLGNCGASGNASGTGTPLPSAGGMTEAEMNAAASTMCKNSGQTWDIAQQKCVTTLIAGVSNTVVYIFGGVLALMLVSSFGGHRR